MPAAITDTPQHLAEKGDFRGRVVFITDAAEIAGARQIVDGICLAHGVSATVRYDTIFPPTINAFTARDAAVQAARSIAGDAAVDPNCPPKLFPEDFAHMAAARPGCFVLTGNGTEGANARPLHAADYDFNDDALVSGASFRVELVEQQLSPGAG